MKLTSLFKDIPDFRLWGEKTISDQKAIDDYTSFNFKIKCLIMSLKLINPTFISTRNLILRQEGLPDDVDKYLDDLDENHGWSAQQIEYAVNHIHLEDVFYNDEDMDKYSEEAMTTLAQFVALAWGERLEKDYPEISFRVGVDTSSGWEIFCYQE